MDKEYSHNHRLWLLKLGLFETRYIIFENTVHPECFEQDDSVIHYDGK